MDRDDSGGITLDEFRHAMKGKLENAAIDAIFEKIDVNKSGYISYTEFLTASSASHAVRCVAPKQQNATPCAQLDG